MWISELASRSGVARRTIRFYEDEGLLEEPTRTAAGYRSYDESAVERLAFIRSAKSLGLTLGDISRVLELADAGTTPCPRVRTMLDEKLTEIDERIDELHALRSRLLALESVSSATATVCPLIEQAG